MTMAMDYPRLAPEIALLTGAVLTLIIGSFLPRNRQHHLTVFAIAALAVAVGLALTQAGPRGTIFDGTFALDHPTTLLRVLAPTATAAILLLGARERRNSPREAETVSLLLLATLGTVVVGGANDLLVLAAGTLLATIPLLGLIGIGRTRLAAEAALKTYLLAALLGITLLGGIAILIGIGGTSTYTDLATALPRAPAPAVAIGAIGVTALLLFEVGAVPAHFWVPDAAQASDRHVAAFLTTVPKLGAVIALLRVTDTVRTSVDLPLIIGLVAAVTMILGTLAAYRQTDVLRLLGWSTVSQAGFLLMPIPAGATTALGIYLTGYTAANIAAFSAVATQPSRPTLQSWHGAARTSPAVAGMLIIALLAFVGTPPTSVFFGKLAVFAAAFQTGQGWLVAVAAITSIASLYYCLRWIISCFHPATDEPVTPHAKAPLAFAVGTVSVAIVIGFALVVPVLSIP
jgi:NADH-quinone oxidoreductase subunit N